MNDFKEVINSCVLRDLGYRVSKYIWCNNKEGEACISVRLDRFLASSSSCQPNPNAATYHGIAAYSHHLPVWLELGYPSKHVKKKRLFRFEIMGTGEEEC